MKSLVLKALRQPKSYENIKIDSQQINLDPNLEICIYSTCNLKSIKGYDFCYKHFKNYNSDKKDSEYKIQLSENVQANDEELIEAAGEYEVPYNMEANPLDNKLSEPDFLYKDLMKKEKFESNLETSELSDKSENELNHFDERCINKKCKRKDYDFLLSKAAVYSKNEIIKVFKSKMLKLDILYKQQLSILNDNIIMSRKQYLTMKSNESSEAATSSTKQNTELANKPELAILKKYKKRCKHRMHLKKKFGRTNSHPVSSNSITKCQFVAHNDPNLKCSKQALPLNNYCIKHVLNDSNQVLFNKCSGYIDNSKECQKPLIESIGLNCPIHISNKFIDSKLSIPEDLIQSSTDDSTCDYDSDKEDENEPTYQPGHDLKSLIHNIKLISVIKEEKNDDFDEHSIGMNKS